MNLGAEQVRVLNAVIDNVTVGATSTVTFTVKDGAGRGATGLKAGASGNVRFAIAKLQPGAAAGDPTSWKSLVNRAAGTAPDQVSQGTADRTGALTDNGNGTYTYTFSTDLTQAKDPVTQAPIAYEPTKTHRLVLQLSGSVNGLAVPAINAVKDFVPNGSAVTETRLIIETKSCNECHGRIVAHGSRYESGYCVVCHNTGLGVPGATGPIADMSFMTHGIHSAGFRAAQGAPEYELAGHQYGEVTYPQELKHCRKCHEESEAAPQGNNWKNVPNKNSCGGCHESTEYNAHVASLQNAQCMTCHGPSSAINSCGPNNNLPCAIEKIHQTVNPTTNNPEIPAGVAKIEYDVPEVTINGEGKAVIKFRVLRDGTPINFATGLTDLTGGPSFLLAYAAPQDGFQAPIDYNNIGNGVSAAQPVTVSLANLRSGAAGNGGGTLAGPDGQGYYTATTNFVFPAGSTMRAVTLQGYFTQTGVPVLGSVARHTIAKVATATGDTPRREIVDSAKCGNCHEWFEAHGGNRVYEVQACVMCHNPNLSSSGRAFDPASALLTQAKKDEIAALLAGTGVQPTAPWLAGTLDSSNPLTWPEESMNLRELLHATHAASMRSNHFTFVRDRGSSGIFPYNFAEITFPNEPNNCEACHKPGTYDTNLPAGELAGVRITPSDTPDSRAAILAARGTLPNASDRVRSPGAAACSPCHDNPQAINHMKINGAYIDGPRSGLAAGNLETCNVCHGTGRDVDSAVAHAE